MCKERPVISVNRVVDPKRTIGKMEGRGGGEAQGAAYRACIHESPIMGIRATSKT
jgi:hypothetical protein